LINNYKHIIWDWNGTLLNDVDFCRRIINRILVENELLELSLEKYREIFTFPVEEYYKVAGLDFSKTSFEVLGKDFMDEYEAKKLSCSLHKNAIEVLSAIHQKGIKQSVLSAYLHDNLVGILEHYNLTQYFDNIIGLDNIYAGSKTHLGLKLIDQLNLPKENILFVGDTLHDSEVAKAMGVKSILIANGHQVKEKLMINSNFVLDEMTQLKKYLCL
jgi:phosphoglycolate phosphatase